MGLSLFGKNDTGDSATNPAPPSIGDLVVKLTSEGIIVVDQALNVIMINPAAERFAETTSAEAVGLNYTAVVRLVNRSEQQLDVIKGALMPNGQSKRRDLMVAGRRSGKKTPVETIVVPFSGGAILSLRDIAQELKAEGEQSDFVSTASHEMRTPVASIRGFIELSLNPQTATIDERARNYLEKAQAASEHLGLLFQNLLDATRLDDGFTVAKLQPVDLTVLAKQVADSMAPNITAKGLAYNFGVDTPSKKLEPALYVHADPDFIGEILRNLIENAIKYTKQGGVTISLGGNENTVSVAVADTGIGIAPVDAEHVFQRFYRADNSDTRAVGGTGLGLYIAMKRAEIMGGTIQLQSTVGKGSVFTLILPRISQAEYTQLQLVAKNNAWVTQGKVVE